MISTYLCKSKWSRFILLSRQFFWSEAQSFINWKYEESEWSVSGGGEVSFRNCKIFTITDNKVWLWSDSLTPLRAGFTQIKAESVNFCNTGERERKEGERTEEVLTIGDKSGDGWTWWRQEERLGGRVVSSWLGSQKIITMIPAGNKRNLSSH